MKANYIEPKIDIIPVDVSCLVADSPNGEQTGGAGGHGPGQGEGDDQLGSRTQLMDDIW